MINTNTKVNQLKQEVKQLRQDLKRMHNLMRIEMDFKTSISMVLERHIKQCALQTPKKCICCIPQTKDGGNTESNNSNK